MCASPAGHSPQMPDESEHSGEKQGVAPAGGGEKPEKVVFSRRKRGKRALRKKKAEEAAEAADTSAEDDGVDMEALRLLKEDMRVRLRRRVGGLRGRD